jgi:hypothetical protein
MFPAKFALTFSDFTKDEYREATFSCNKDKNNYLPSGSQRPRLPMDQTPHVPLPKNPALRKFVFRHNIFSIYFERKKW